MVDFTVTRDGRRIAWRKVDRQGSNLMLIENFRKTRSLQAAAAEGMARR
jgi:hypothetical protein